MDSRLIKASTLSKLAKERTSLLISYDVHLVSGEKVVVGEKYLTGHKKEIRRLFANGIITKIEKRN